MNRATYTPATDDLFQWDGSNTGLPTGWNANHPLYPERAALGCVRAARRSFDIQSTQYPGDGTLAQKPNHWNANQPLLWAMDDRLLAGSLHFWESGLFDRNRNAATLGIWGAQDVRFMREDGSLVPLVNAEVIRGWTRGEDGTPRTRSDFGMFEITSGVPPAIPAFARFAEQEELVVPHDAWLLTPQGVCVAVTVTRSSPAANSIAIDIPGYQAVWSGDSGSTCFDIVDGRVRIFAWAVSGLTGLTGVHESGLPDTTWISARGPGRELEVVRVPHVRGDGIARQSSLGVAGAIAARIAGKLS